MDELDPEPYVSKWQENRHAGSQDCWAYCRFEPRPEFAQDQSRYNAQTVH